jgi:hypothetical protein
MDNRVAGRIFGDPDGRAIDPQIRLYRMQVPSSDNFGAD